MAITVDPITNGDFTRIDRADSIGAWKMPLTTPTNAWSMIALNNASQVENTGCIEAGKVSAGVGIAYATFTSRSLENVHLRCWSKLAQNISSLSTYGAQLSIGGSRNYGSWKVYGSDRQVVVNNGWMMLVVDPRKPFDGATGGTIPSDILTITNAGIRVDFTDANGKALAVLDMLWEGNEVSIEGGTTGARGTFTEWSSDDITNGYGILRNVGGVYYLNAGAVFQGVGTATSYFEDTNQVVVFEDLPVSGSLYKFRHVGNATGTNHFQLGETSGSGTDQEGSGGGVMRAAGDIPFRIEAIDSNIDACNYYGVTMLGPNAIYDDQVRNCKIYDGGSFTDDTTDFNDADANDISPFPTPAVNDAIYFGHDERFYNISINTGTAKSGTYTIVWEYSQGSSSWASLTDLTDGTNGFTTTGAQTVTYAIPDDWATDTADSDTRYWIRARISAYTSSSTVPLLTVGTVGMIGDVRLEDPNVDMVGCTLTGMGAVRVRNGAFLKKTTIDSSTAPAKHAALDLGSADPTTNTVRDLTIQNCNKGILLKGSGNITYNFRNIQFNGNTNDVRVDFGGSDTVTINILEFGDSPSVDNVNSSTVNIVSIVNVTVMIKNQAGTVLPGVEVAIFQDNTARTVVLASTPTDENGEVTTTANTNLGAIIIRARQSTDTMSFLTSSSTTDGVDDASGTINNPTPHKFQAGDAVVYSQNGGSQNIGLTDGTTYYVDPVIGGDTTSVTMHATAAAAIAGTGDIALTAGGSETHKLDPVRYVAGSATGTIGAVDFAAQLTLITDTIATG